MKSFLDGQRLVPGTIYEVPIQVKVEGWRDTNYGKSLDLCVLASGEISEVGEVEDGDPKGKDPVKMAVGYEEE